MNVEPQAARIAIVDDEPAQMNALCDTLQSQGYAVSGFVSPSPALEAFRAQSFDLVLADLMMPEMDGISLLRAALKLDPHLTGIIMTGEGSITTAVEAMKAGALDYILKPFKLSVILPVLSRALAVRQLRLRNAELERQLRERAAELEAANRDLELFSASVSHDLRAPVRSVNGFSSILQDQYSKDLPPEAQRLLKTIQNSALRMGQLIDDLMRLARLARQTLARQPVKMSALTETVWRELSAEQNGRPVEFQQGNMPDTVGDPALLKQAMLNLLSNAIKFSGKKDAPKIETGSLSQDGCAVFFVRDNGAGFNMERAERLFTPFQRMHSDRDYPGTGIGLSIVHRIIQRHGGRIWAESAPGQGASFFFTLEPPKGEKAADRKP